MIAKQPERQRAQGVVQRLLNQKLESLRRCVQRIELKLPASAQALSDDLDAQDIIALNLTRAVQMCVDTGAHWLAQNADTTSPRTMGETFDALAQADVISPELAIRLRKSVGFRNVMIHNYDEVNWEIVYAIGSRHLDDFKAFARALG